MSKEQAAKPELLAPCGLYCGDCYANTGEIADQARDLRKTLRSRRFKDYAKAIPFKEFKHYEECYACLGAMVKLRCRKGCRQGGGNPYCKIRICADKKGFQGCWECSEFQDCNNLKFLESTHGERHFKNLRKLRRSGVEKFLAGKREF